MIATSRDGVALWWESTGAGIPVLLVPGRGDSTDVYPECFSAALVASGCQVIRYDPRDTGRSGDGGATYTLGDMADDAVTVLDAAEVAAAHLVGLSMGGVLLVDLATRRPERVASLVFLSALSPDPEAGIGEDFFAAFGADPIEGRLQAMGETSDSDRTWVAAEVERSSARAAARPEAMDRHQAAAFRLGWPEPERLGDIGVPTLVFHGDADRVLPLDHAHALASGIAGSELVVMPGMGHLPRRTEWDDIARHTARHVEAAART